MAIAINQLRVGQQIKHVVSGRIVVIHEVDCCEEKAMAIESRIVPEIDLGEWVLVKPGRAPVELLKPSRYNSLQIGENIRRKDEGVAFLISAIANELIFANRLRFLSNPDEWESLES